MKSNLRVHIAPVGFELERITDPILREKADKVYLITNEKDDKGTSYLQTILRILDDYKNIEVEKLTSDIWDLFDLINKFKDVFTKEASSGSHVYVNVSTGSKVASIAGTLACMIWKGMPYYAHIDYDYEEIDENGLKHEKVTKITDLPVYSINLPKEESLKVLKILKQANGKIKKKNLIQRLEAEGYINATLGIEAKHSRLRVLLNQLSTGSDNPQIKVDYLGRQSNVTLTAQGEATLRIFGDTNTILGQKHIVRWNHG